MGDFEKLLTIENLGAMLDSKLEENGTQQKGRLT